MPSATDVPSPQLGASRKQQPAEQMQIKVNVRAATGMEGMLVLSESVEMWTDDAWHPRPTSLHDFTEISIISQLNTAVYTYAERFMDVREVLQTDIRFERNTDIIFTRPSRSLPLEHPLDQLPSRTRRQSRAKSPEAVTQPDVRSLSHVAFVIDRQAEQVDVRVLSFRH